MKEKSLDIKLNLDKIKYANTFFYNHYKIRFKDCNIKHPNLQFPIVSDSSADNYSSIIREDLNFDFHDSPEMKSKLFRYVINNPIFKYDNKKKFYDQAANHILVNDEQFIYSINSIYSKFEKYLLSSESGLTQSYHLCSLIAQHKMDVESLIFDRVKYSVVFVDHDDFHLWMRVAPNDKKLWLRVSIINDDCRGYEVYDITDHLIDAIYFILNKQFCTYKEPTNSHQSFELDFTCKTETEN